MGFTETFLDIAKRRPVSGVGLGATIPGGGMGGPGLGRPIPPEVPPGAPTPGMFGPRQPLGGEGFPDTKGGGAPYLGDAPPSWGGSGGALPPGVSRMTGGGTRLTDLVNAARGRPGFPPPGSLFQPGAPYRGDASPSWPAPTNLPPGVSAPTGVSRPAQGDRLTDLLRILGMI